MSKQEKFKSRQKKKVRELSSEKERILSEHRDIRDFFERRPDHAVRGEKVALSKLSEAEYHTRLLLEEEGDFFLSEA